jgi:hypothetical protein
MSDMELKKKGQTRTAMRSTGLKAHITLQVLNERQRRNAIDKCANDR